MAAEREQTRYVAGLFALVACGTAWFGIGMIARLLDLPLSELLLWPAAAFGIAVASSYGFRIVFILSLAVLVVGFASVFFAAGGVPWPSLFERLEPLAGTSFVLLALSSHLRAMGEGFDRAARVRPAGHDDSILRWNTGVRVLPGPPGLRPSSEIREEPLFLR